MKKGKFVCLLCQARILLQYWLTEILGHIVLGRVAERISRAPFMYFTFNVNADVRFADLYHASVNL